MTLSGAPQPVVEVLEQFDEELLKTGGGFTLASRTHFCERLVDARQAVNLVLYVWGSNNQDVTVQVVGYTGPDPQNPGRVNLGASVTLLAATGSVPSNVESFGIDLRGTRWYPYLGVVLTTGSTPPTAGTISVRAIGLRRPAVR